MTSDGLVVDHTPPEVAYITTKDNSLFQQQNDVLRFLWDFHDLESGIAEYRCVVTESYQGVLNDHFWPGGDEPHVVALNETSATSGDLGLGGLWLKNGGQYRLRVTALNRANMATAEESNPVTVDTTPPDILQVQTHSCDKNDDFKLLWLSLMVAMIITEVILRYCKISVSFAFAK